MGRSVASVKLTEYSEVDMLNSRSAASIAKVLLPMGKGAFRKTTGYEPFFRKTTGYEPFFRKTTGYEFIFRKTTGYEPKGVFRKATGYEPFEQ